MIKVVLTEFYRLMEYADCQYALDFFYSTTPSSCIELSLAPLILFHGDGKLEVRLENKTLWMMSMQKPNMTNLLLEEKNSKR